MASALSHCLHPKRMPVCIPVSLLLIKFPANLDKAVVDDSSAWAPAILEDLDDDPKHHLQSAPALAILVIRQ